MQMQTIEIVFLKEVNSGLNKCLPFIDIIGHIGIFQIFLLGSTNNGYNFKVGITLLQAGNLFNETWKERELKVQIMLQVYNRGLIYEYGFSGILGMIKG